MGLNMGLASAMLERMVGLDDMALTELGNRGWLPEIVGDEHAEFTCDPGILMGTAMGNRELLPLPSGVR